MTRAMKADFGCYDSPLNNALVKDFIKAILVEGKMDKLAGFFDGDNYLQDNLQIADGLSGLGKALETLAKAETNSAM